MRIGIIREGKNPPDERVPLTPEQCKKVMNTYPDIELVVQKSNVRAFKDSEYEALGVPIVEDLHDCDVIFGVKEVNLEDLIPNKHFFFFSHTFKKQPYNRRLLKAILDHKIQLTDYEVLTNEKGIRVIGFGRYAGIVGCYNGFRTYGIKHQSFELKPAHQCADRKEMESELQKIVLPPDFKLVATGFGRVGLGAREILSLLPIKEVSPKDFLNQTYAHPVFTHLNVDDYNERTDGEPFDRAAFYRDGVGHVSTFSRYLGVAGLYVACHYWKKGAPIIITKEDLKAAHLKTSVIADISCDIDGPIASTIRPSTIADPIYGYHRFEEREADVFDENAIAVMAVDNLPCELPKDASQDFGNEIITHILPALLGEDGNDLIARGSQTNKNGELTAHFSYLENYVAGKE